jgi:hypothetical protein
VPRDASPRAHPASARHTAAAARRRCARAGGLAAEHAYVPGSGRRSTAVRPADDSPVRDDAVLCYGSYALLSAAVAGAEGVVARRPWLEKKKKDARLKLRSPLLSPALWAAAWGDFDSHATQIPSFVPRKRDCFFPRPLGPSSSLPLFASFEARRWWLPAALSPSDPEPLLSVRVVVILIPARLGLNALVVAVWMHARAVVLLLLLAGLGFPPGLLRGFKSRGTDSMSDAGYPIPDVRSRSNYSALHGWMLPCW